MSKNFELLQQTSGEHHLFQTSNQAPSLVAAAGIKPSPAQSKAIPEKDSKTTALPSHWLEAIKGEIRHWERHVQARNNYRRTDLEAMVREEAVKLTQRVFSATGRRSPQVVVFSGVENEAGCGSICARTGEILAAQNEGPVCVVDANFRSPFLHQYFGLDNLKGLAEAVLESGPVQSFVQRLPECNLWVMPSGLAVARIRFPQASDRLQARLTELRGEFRHVVIHSSSLRGDNDSILLSRWTDGVVLVVEADSTRREVARRVKENLEVANVCLLGVVLSNRTFPVPQALYHRL